MAHSKCSIGVYGIRGIPSTYSGYETFMTRLLPDLVDRGHAVTLYTRKAFTPEYDNFKGVRLRPLPAAPFKSLETLSHGFVAALAAQRARHDVILVANVGNSLFTWIHLLKGQKVVLNTDGLEWTRGKWGPIGRVIFRLAAKLSRFTTSALISDCNAIRDVYQVEFGAQSSVIPYSAPEVATADHGVLPYGLVPGKFFFHAARLNPENNAVATAEAYITTSTDLPLVIAGTANYNSPIVAELERIRAADSRVILIGHISDRELFYSLQRTATAYIHSHSVGGINPSLLEAMSGGARILALDTPFNREALGSSGEYFSDFGGELKMLLKHINLDPLLDASLRIAASSRAATVFAHATVVNSYEQLLTEVLTSPKPRGFVLKGPWDKAPE